MLEQLTRILKKRTGNQELEITPETIITKDLGLTSFDLIQLICAVEDEFDIEIPDRVIKNMQTIGDVIDFIEKQ